MTNKQLPIPAAPGRGTLAQGHQPTIQELADQLSVEVRSLKARLDIGDIEGEPAAYQGVRVFTPDSTSFEIDAYQNGSSSVPVNYVVKDSTIYDIPINVPGPGIFIATGLHVSITQRRYDPAVPEALQQNYATNWYKDTISAQFDPFALSWTTKFCLWPYQPKPYQFLTNFLWNIMDARTGDLYGDEPMNCLLLRPRQDGDSDGNYHTEGFMDGGLFQFDTPWVFPYGTNAIFKFLPVNPIVQLDSIIGPVPGPLPYVSGLNYDDRENGIRDQSVTVRAMLTGYRMMVAPGI